ncbi:MAG: hypothetical protein Q9191_006088 [Dirinaria sp. TL-2023a]
MAPRTRSAGFHPAGPQHEAFTQWSKDRGVEINKVSPARIPGRGLGMIARRRIEAGEELMNVPASALLTEKSIPESFRKRHGDITVHGLLASFLAFGGTDVQPYAPWQATWPSFADFQACMPLLWPDILRNRFDSGRRDVEKRPSVLPPAIDADHRLELSTDGLGTSPGLLLKQERNFKRDWSIVGRVVPDACKDTFLYYWLVVNTRTFYYELPGLNGKRPKEDRMVMCPFVDYFNHADQGCDVAFDENGYTVTADKNYDAGQEIYVSYGSHSNDFLLVECEIMSFLSSIQDGVLRPVQDGFILDKNKWDYLPLDDLLLPGILRQRHRRDKLEREGYLGNYILTAEGVCHRTEVAIRTLTLNNHDWQRYVEGLSVSKEACDEPRTNTIIETNILSVYHEAVQKTLKALDEIDNESVKLQKETLTRRWLQIEVTVERARRGFRRF